MAKITFIHPNANSETDFKGKKTTIPPEGLCLLAAIVREQGYEPNIIDAAALLLNNKEVIEILKKQQPDFIGITSTTVNIYSTSKLADIIKEEFPNVPIILGGAHITIEPQSTMKEFKSIDIGVIGEAEITIIELLETLTAKKSLKTVKGIIYREDNKIIQNLPNKIIEDLDSLPIPAWELLPEIKKHYKQSVARAERKPSMSIMTSRGCPGKCIFCVQNQKLRGYSAERLIFIVKYLIEKYKIKSLEINDDNFVVFKERLIQFCNKIIDEKIDITWSCMSRVNHVDEEILELMKKAGCRRIAYGIESGSQEILNFEKKGITIEQIKRAVNLTHKAGIKVTGYFILGHPLETKETINQTINLALELPFDDYLPSFMIPYPGSELYNIAEQYGTFKKDWKNMYQWNINFVPKGFTEKELEEYFKTSLRRFYFRPRIIWNYTQKLINPKYSLDFIKEGTNALSFMIKK